MKQCGQAVSAGAGELPVWTLRYLTEPDGAAVAGTWRPHNSVSETNITPSQRTCFRIKWLLVFSYLIDC